MMKKTKLSVAALLLAFTCFVGGCAGVTSQTRNPEKTGDGASAEQVTPETNSSQGSSGSSSDSSSSASDWQPGIYDYDEDVPIGGTYDFSTVYNYSSYSLTARDGALDNSTAGTYAVASGSSRLLCATQDTATPFPYGSFTADVVNNTSDTGIIFGLSSTSDKFWEAGSSYYFFFVSQVGLLYLGKVDNGWQMLAAPKISGWTAGTKYTIRVIYKGNKILGFVNGTHMFSYTDSSPLTGTGWGVRIGAAGATVSNLKITSSFDK